MTGKNKITECQEKDCHEPPMGIIAGDKTTGLCHNEDCDWFGYYHKHVCEKHSI